MCFSFYCVVVFDHLLMVYDFHDLALVTVLGLIYLIAFWARSFSLLKSKSLIAKAFPFAFYIAL